MNFTKLSANSEKLLLEITQADNPAQILCARFINDHCHYKELPF